MGRVQRDLPMFDTLILLTGPVDETVLATLLGRQNPHLAIRHAKTADELAAIPDAVLARARLIAFVTPVIVPKRILEALGCGAYNFHPAPPTYPGWVPSHLAVYDRATRYGATAHEMVERVDAGPIIDVEWADVPPGAAVVDYERIAFKALAPLFARLAVRLTQAAPLAPCGVAWSGRKTTRRMYEAMCDIPLDIAPDELDRRLAAFGGSHLGPYPTVTINGRRYRLAADTAAPAQAAG